jgi:hypothetical protein
MDRDRVPEKLDETVSTPPPPNLDQTVTGIIERPYDVKLPRFCGGYSRWSTPKTFLQSLLTFLITCND